MVTCEMSLDRVEELFVGSAGELRPALAIGDPSLSSIDPRHFDLIIAARWSHCAPPSVSLGDPRSTGWKMLKPRWRYVSETLPSPREAVSVHARK
jgi:hypothetical protein